MFFLSLGILVLALILSFGALRPRSERPFGNILKLNFNRKFNFIKLIFIISVIAVFSLLIYYSYQQYVAWAGAEPSKFLLPPYQSIDYFIKYVGGRFFAPYLISLIAAILFLFAANRLNKKYNERFFHPEEPYLGALAIFVIGHPGWLFYFAGLIIFYLLFSIFYFLFSKRNQRISLYWWWLPMAIFVIIINKWLIELELWRLLKI